MGKGKKGKATDAVAAPSAAAASPSFAAPAPTQSSSGRTAAPAASASAAKAPPPLVPSSIAGPPPRSALVAVHPSRYISELCPLSFAGATLRAWLQLAAGDAGFPNPLLSFQCRLVDALVLDRTEKCTKSPAVMALTVAS